MLEINIVNVSEDGLNVDVIDSTERIEIVESQDVIRETGPRGLPGASGTNGSNGRDGGTITRIAGEAIGGHRVVRVVSGKSYYVNQNDDDQVTAAIGVTTGAADADAEQVIVLSGEVTESSWNWTPGQPLYLNGIGELSHSVPQTGAVRQIAIAESETTIIVCLQMEIRR